MRPPSFLRIGVVLLALVLVGGSLWARASVQTNSTRVESLRSEVRALKRHVGELQDRLQSTMKRLEAESAQRESANRSIRRLKERAVDRQSCGRGANWGPHVWFFPSRAPVGARVEMVGDCFITPLWQNVAGDEHAVPFLAGAIGVHGPAGAPDIGESSNPEDCELHAESEGRFRIHPDGRMDGWFIVPSEGICSYEDGETHAVIPGTYEIEFSYHMGAGRFKVVP